MKLKPVFYFVGILKYKLGIITKDFNLNLKKKKDILVKLPNPNSLK